jgi:Tfp pilus assembly protein PilO
MISRLIPALIILIAVAIFFGYINPTYTGHVAALRTEIQGYDSALLAAKQFSEKEAQVIAERDAIPAEGLARIEAFLPDGVDNVQLIIDLNALASRSGLTLSNFDIAAVPTDKGQTGDKLSLVAESPYEYLDISVSAVGSYAAFKTFLRGAEWSLRPLDLVDLAIGESKTGVYTYEMTFRIYWLR